MRHRNVSLMLDRAITPKLREDHTASIITGRSSHMQRLVISALKELGFDDGDMIIYCDKIELSW